MLVKSSRYCSPFMMSTSCLVAGACVTVSLCVCEFSCSQLMQLMRLNFFLKNNTESAGRGCLTVIQLSFNYSCTCPANTLITLSIIVLPLLKERGHWSVIYTQAQKHTHNTNSVKAFSSSVCFGRYNRLRLDFIMPPTSYIWSIGDRFVLVYVPRSELMMWAHGGLEGLYAYNCSSTALWLSPLPPLPLFPLDLFVPPLFSRP